MEEEGEERYAGIIKAPEGWWLCKSKLAYEAWDWEYGPVRDMVLTMAKAVGMVSFLGPRSMSPAQAMAAAYRFFGHEVAPGDALKGFTPATEAGQEFMTGTGQFARDEEENT